MAPMLIGRKYQITKYYYYGKSNNLQAGVQKRLRFKSV